MAQLVARFVRNEKVGGSNPPSSTLKVAWYRHLLAPPKFDGYSFDHETKRNRIEYEADEWAASF